MKKEKCILLFDDKDQKSIIDDIKLALSQEFNPVFIFIRTSAADLKKDDSEDLDINKLKTKVESEIKGKHIDIALTDFDLECSYFNGLDVINMVHEIRKNVSFFVYSGNWNKVIQCIIGKDYKDAPPEQLVEGINKLIHDQIIDCIGRTEYKDDLIKHLKKNNVDSIEHRLSTLLRANGSMRFDSCFPEFKGKTFAEIADMIDDKSDARSDEWIEVILAQTIAYLTEVNQ